MTTEGADGKLRPATRGAAAAKRAAIAELAQAEPGLSDRQLAKKTGASPATVARVKHWLKTAPAPTASKEIDKFEVRTSPADTVASKELCEDIRQFISLVGKMSEEDLDTALSQLWNTPKFHKLVDRKFKREYARKQSLEKMGLIAERLEPVMGCTD